MRRPVGVVTATLCLAVTGCSSEPRPASDPPTPPSSADPDAPTRSDPLEGPPEGPRPRPPAPLTLAFAGDVHFEGVLRPRLDDPATALAPARGLGAVLAGADVAMVNLETSLGSGGRPEPGKRYPFQAPLSALTAVREAGVDLATMANNHALDHGREPLPALWPALESAAAAEPPLAVVGIGRDAEEAFAPARLEVRGTRVAAVAATVADQDPTADPTGQWAATGDSAGTADALRPGRLLRAVRRAARTSEVTVVYVHWGVQGERCPSADQRELAADLVGAGGDVVVGSHAHLLQGDGPLGPGYVAYGLGNYAWYTTSSGASPATGVLTLTVQPPRRRVARARVVGAEWTGGVIGTDGLPAPVSGAAAAAFDDQVRSLRSCAGLPPDHVATSGRDGAS